MKQQHTSVPTSKTKPAMAISADRMDSCHKVISACLFPPPQEVLLGQLSTRQ